MIRSVRLIFLAGIFISFYSCTKDFQDDEQYKHPDWLTGKLYTQIEAQPELSTFAYCVKRTGLDAVINISGRYTVFAPDNDAFIRYLAQHAEYKTVDDIPVAELTKIVKSHIIKDGWSVDQLRKLDINGWIDPTDENNNKPKGFKRETLLRNNDSKFGMLWDVNNYLRIVDTTLTPWYRKQNTDGNKYASIFYNEYLDIYNLNSKDYEFYFGRPFDNYTDMYYLDGKIVKGNVFAENGFIHVIDRVTEPLQNAYEILQANKAMYSNFLDLINTFPSFNYNKDKTNAQPGASSGAVVDSLFDITYPQLAFSIVNEQTKAPTGTSGMPDNVTVRYQNGLVAPTNEALDAFVADYLVGNGKWGSLSKAPDFFRKLIVNSCMSNSPIYPTYFDRGFLNGEEDYIKLDKSTIIQKKYGSNSTFIGVKKAIVPRVFNSVAGPVYLNKNYSQIMYAVEDAGLLAALKTENKTYAFYLEADTSCVGPGRDSSFICELTKVGGQSFRTYAAYTKSGTLWLKQSILIPDLRILLLNHIGTLYPSGLPLRKEFIPNLAGNYIIVNNVTEEVSGTDVTRIGYKGSVPVQVKPKLISESNVDNGKTYNISNWFSFSAPDLNTKIQAPSTGLSHFFALLQKAKLYLDAELSNSFLSKNEFYTVFAPTDAALIAYNADTMSIPTLKKFLMLHFVQGALIFTDGKKPANYYETTRIDEKSTPYTKVFSKMYIEPGINVINIKDKSGNIYTSIPESDAANMITGSVVSTTGAYPDTKSTGVIHKIDKVLLFNELDTK